MIKPTVGRIVWFWPSPPIDETQQALAAIVTRVWSDTCVNLAIFMSDGNSVTNPMTSIRLLQDDETAPTSGHYCQWMPYQIAKS